MKSRYVLVLIYFVLTVALFFTAGGNHELQAASTTNSWLDKPIEITESHDISAGTYDTHISNNDCYPVKASVYEAVNWWEYGPLQPWNEFKYCAIQGQNGYFSNEQTNPYVIPYGSDTVQKVISSSGSKILALNFFPVHGTNRIVVIDRQYGPYTPSAFRLHIINDWNKSFIPHATLVPNNIERSFNETYDFTLDNEDGTVTEGIYTDGMSMSNNGDWLQLHLPNRSHIILNTVTHEIIPFTASDQQLTIQSAVSNDGRFIVMTHHDTENITVYDTTRCQPAQGKFVSKNCQSIELIGDDNAPFKNEVAGKNFAIGKVKFIGNGDALDIDVRFDNGTEPTFKTYRVKPSGVDQVKYLALGDSFSSGEGAYDYRSPTNFYVNENSYNLCHQSKNSYPYVMQKALQFEWFHLIACSGAVEQDIDNDDTEYYLSNNSQAKAIDQGSKEKIENYLKIFSPGYIPQNEFNKADKPNIETVSIGGNDIGFSAIVQACIANKLLMHNECFSNRNEKEALASSIDFQIPKLAALFQSLKNEMGGSDPRLYVVGYPKMVSSKGICGVNSLLTYNEITFANNLVDYLDTAIKVAADNAGAKYIDISEAFVVDDKDYRLCGNQPAPAANGIVFRGTTNKKPDNVYYAESFHPNQLGQSLISATVLAQSKDLTQTMPAPSNSLDVLTQKRIALVGDSRKELDNYRLVYDEHITVQFLPKDKPLELKIGPDNELLPASNAQAIIKFHSDPVTAGALPIAADGSITGTIAVPASLPAGYHQLHITYIDIANKTIDRYKYVYVAESSSDYDGDGRSNEVDPCPFNKESNIDHDKDGIDDACDSEYIASELSHDQNNAVTDDQSNSSEPVSLQKLPTPTPGITFISPSEIKTDQLFSAADNDKDKVMLSKLPSSQPNDVRNRTSGSNVYTRPIFTFVSLAAGVVVCMGLIGLLVRRGRS